MKLFLSLRSLGLLLIATQIIFVGCNNKSSDSNPAYNEILIGALLPISTYDEGILGKATMQYAVDDFNAFLIKAGSPDRFKLVIADTESDSSTTIQAVEELYAQGVRLLAGGPSSSMELGAIMDYINVHQMLMLNAYSTAPSLAIMDDNIFRLVTDDTKQSKAISKYLNFDGISAVIVVWRHDNYGQGLSEAFATDYVVAGGTLINSIPYDFSTTEFSSLTSELNSQIIAAKSQYGTENVGICCFGFDETTMLFEDASAQSDLGTVKWYGCDGNAVINEMASNPVSAAFALQVNFTALNVGLGTADFTPKNAANLSERVQLATGLQPNVNTLSAYDAVRILGNCYLATNNQEVELIKSVLPEICSTYNFLGITRELNEAGDLLNANYIFWKIETSGSSKIWNTSATYFADGDYIELKH